MNDKMKYKLRATSFHMFISFLIFLVILYFILFEWYPEPFFTAQGGWQGIRLMALVDLVLGPTLTFIVFNHLKKKKEIVTDLSLIAVVQIVALTWGGYTVYTQRPIALVFWANAFYTVTSDDYADQGIDNPDFSKFSSHIPPLVYVRSPETLFELEESNQLTNKGIPIYAHVESYENIDTNLEEIFSSEIDIQEVMSNNADMKVALENIINNEVSTYRYIPLKAKYRNMVMIFEQNGKFVGQVKAPYL